MSDIEKPPRSLTPKMVDRQTIIPVGGGIFNEAAGGESYDLVVKKSSSDQMEVPGSPGGAGLTLQELQDEEAMMQSPRRRKMYAHRSLLAGSYNPSAEAINEAVKPVVSNALIVSSINCFIAFIGLFIETYKPDDTASAGTSAGVEDASSGGSSSDGAGAKSSGKMRTEEIYAGLMSSLRAFLHVAFLIMIFQVLMGRVHLKRAYNYVLFLWCTVLSVCYLIIKTASKDDFTTWFSAEITMHVCDTVFFGFSCYVLSVTRSEHSQEREDI
jgi:hypothetical protein